MSEQDLREQLRHLSAELESLPPASEQRRRVETLIADIHARLDSGEADESLTAQVEMAVSSFEAEHPRLAGILNNILVTLGSIGV
jgi:hypothetical protein